MCLSPRGAKFTCQLPANGVLVLGDNSQGQRDNIPSPKPSQPWTSAERKCAALGGTAPQLCRSNDDYGQASPPLRARTSRWQQEACTRARSIRTARSRPFRQHSPASSKVSPGTYKGVAAGQHSGLQHEIECWGENSAGQTATSSPQLVTPFARVTSIAVPSTDGTAVCWGNNANGQTSVPPETFTAWSWRRLLHLRPQSGWIVRRWGSTTTGSRRCRPNLHAAQPGGEHTCALKPMASRAVGAITSAAKLLLPLMDGTVRRTMHRPARRRHARLLGNKQLRAATCRRYVQGGRRRCGHTWATTGRPVAPLGDRNTGPMPRPRATTSSPSPGTAHSCAMRQDASVSYDEHRHRESMPAGPFKAISAGGYFTCGSSVDQRLWSPACWGSAPPTPTPWSAPTHPSSAAIAHACAIDMSGDVTCWGDNTQGQVNDLPGVYTVTGGTYNSCGSALGQQHQLLGDNVLGQSSPCQCVHVYYGGRRWALHPRHSNGRQNYVLGAIPRTARFTRRDARIRGR